MKHLKDLRDFWRLNESQPKALCTIVGKTGSSYRHEGAKKIVLKNGDACGYLSGGCLERDIVRTALEKWDVMPFRQRFSTMSEEDRLMGYQTGCAGAVDILFERLPDDASRMDDYIPYGPACGREGIGISLSEDTFGQRRSLGQGDASVRADTFVDKWVEPFHLYVLGCGPNAYPLADFAPPLGWDVTFLDYREGNVIPREGISSAVIPLEKMTDGIADGPRSAVVVMTHNYEADMEIVRQLHGRDFFYIGCVGPKKRFVQIGDDLKKFHDMTLDPAWADKVHAPAGVKQGYTPEDIAFSIVSEIQMKLPV